MCLSDRPIAPRQEARRRPHDAFATRAVSAVPVALELRGPQPDIPTWLCRPSCAAHAPDRSRPDPHKPKLTPARDHARAVHRGLRRSLQRDCGRRRGHVKRPAVTATCGQPPNHREHPHKHDGRHRHSRPHTPPAGTKPRPPTPGSPLTGWQLPSQLGEQLVAQAATDNRDSLLAQTRCVDRVSGRHEAVTSVIGKGYASHVVSQSRIVLHPYIRLAPNFITRPSRRSSLARMRGGSRASGVRGWESV